MTKASGQQVNINKSAVFFSKNSSERERDEVLQKLGGIQQVSQGKYLGLPLVVGRSKNSVFRFIKENMMSRIQGWKGKLLGNAGKEVLLKSVALALPSYAMSVFRLSKSLCKELSGMMARFWWVNDQGEKRMHWKKWTNIAERKKNGGLGFRDLLCFNEALLAKQAWRLITCPNLLVSKKQVGDGASVDIWEDRWVESSKTGKVTSPKPAGCQTIKVCNLIKGKQWNKDLITVLFSKEEAEAILQIPLSLFQKKDRYKWRYTANGSYSTKSGYGRAKDRIKEMNRPQVNSNTNKERSKMQQARSRNDGNKHIEIIANFLWQIWKTRNEWNFNQVLKEGHQVSKKAMEEWMEYDEAGRDVKRDNEETSQPGDRHRMLVGLMEQHSNIMYTDAGMSQEPLEDFVIFCILRFPSPIERLTTCHQGKAKAGVGIIAKVNNGRILVTWSIPHTRAKDAAEMEAIAIRTALGKAIEENMTSLLIMSDCKAVVDRINTGCQGLTSMDMLIEDIRQLSCSFWKCTFFHIRREMNMCSHGLAKLAINLIQETRWKQSFPVWLNREAHNDFLAVASLL
ncbi:uncharacterized protein LOC113770308 [Coffea eugenioides]|uniref:uncharacterized protein LOC113770308 n=1 Tax=Coffea eugenioides TaxID=49369 RepID=UPI000F6123C1|nr:uncharacterized protein LOC113770308 [Coffea eugenioides]